MISNFKMKCFLQSRGVAIKKATPWVMISYFVVCHLFIPDQIHHSSKIQIFHLWKEEVKKELFSVRIMSFFKNFSISRSWGLEPIHQSLNEGRGPSKSSTDTVEDNLFSFVFLHSFCFYYVPIIDARSFNMVHVVRCLRGTIATHSFSALTRSCQASCINLFDPFVS